jgi:hypothetical protein
VTGARPIRLVEWVARNIALEEAQGAGWLSDRDYAIKRGELDATPIAPEPIPSKPDQNRKIRKAHRPRLRKTRPARVGGTKKEIQ